MKNKTTTQNNRKSYNVIFKPIKPKKWKRKTIAHEIFLKRLFLTKKKLLKTPNKNWIIENILTRIEKRNTNKKEKRTPDGNISNRTK